MIESPGLAIFLIACAGFTSFITTGLGIGGGVMLIAIMAQVLPAEIIIPVHGIVQLGSNASRTLMAWRAIDWSVIGAFLPGALVGALIGSLVIVSLSPAYLYLTIAAFTLLLCWGPQIPPIALGRAGTMVAGALTTFLTLFAGATGPLVGAFVRQKYTDRFVTVSTFAAAMSVQHSLKIFVFQFAGFDVRPWVLLTAAMIASGAVGTWIGFKLLRRVSDHHFGLVFKVVLTLLAGRLIWQAISSGIALS